MNTEGIRKGARVSNRRNHTKVQTAVRNWELAIQIFKVDVTFLRLLGWIASWVRWKLQAIDVSYFFKRLVFSDSDAKSWVKWGHISIALDSAMTRKSSCPVRALREEKRIRSVNRRRNLDERWQVGNRREASSCSKKPIFYLPFHVCVQWYRTANISQERGGGTRRDVEQLPNFGILKVTPRPTEDANSRDTWHPFLLSFPLVFLHDLPLGTRTIPIHLRTQRLKTRVCFVMLLAKRDLT
jgi:hypothetical protein